MTTELPTPVARRARARWRSAAILATALVASATVAAVGGALVVFARDVWFDNLQRPRWVLSTWGFLVVGTAAYLALGVVGWRLWVRAPASVLFTGWLVLLGLHLAWTVLFFGLWVPRWALGGAAVLAGAGLATAGRRPAGHPARHRPADRRPGLDHLPHRGERRHRGVELTEERANLIEKLPRCRRSTARDR